jgi:hypothetical protein
MVALPLWRRPLAPHTQSMGGSRSHFGRCAEEKSLLLPGIERRVVDCPGHNPVAILT